MKTIHLAILVRFENFELSRINLDAWLVCKNNPSQIFRLKCHESRPAADFPEYDEDGNVIKDPNYGGDYWNSYWKGGLCTRLLRLFSKKLKFWLFESHNL